MNDLCMMQGSLFYFVLFVTLKSPKSWCFMSRFWYLWKALNEQGCGSYWLLNHFLNENEIKSKLKSVLEFGGVFGVVGKPLATYLLEFISHFSKLKCIRYWFLNGFCCWKFKQIAKIGFGRKISWAFNVFTLGPMA